MMDKYTEPDYSKIALITIDMQNDFSLKGAPLEIKGTQEIIPNLINILKKFREKNKPIVHLVRLYKEDGSNVDICRRYELENGLKVVSPDSNGAELVQELKLYPQTKTLNSEILLKGEIQEISNNEFVMYKPRWGAFYKTPLETFLREKGITTLVFTGCNFQNCPRASIYEASERDFKIVVIEDAISGIYKNGIIELKNISCRVIKANDFVKML